MAKKARRPLKKGKKLHASKLQRKVSTLKNIGLLRAPMIQD